MLPLISFWFCPPPIDDVEATITSCGCPSTICCPPPPAPPPPRVVMGEAEAEVVGVPPFAAPEDGGFAAEAGVLRVASFTSLNFSMNCKGNVPFEENVFSTYFH